MTQTNQTEPTLSDQHNLLTELYNLVLDINLSGNHICFMSVTPHCEMVEVTLCKSKSSYSIDLFRGKGYFLQAPTDESINSLSNLISELNDAEQAKLPTQIDRVTTQLFDDKLNFQLSDGTKVKLISIVGSSSLFVEDSNKKYYTVNKSELFTI